MSAPVTRRAFLHAASAVAAGSTACSAVPERPGPAATGAGASTPPSIASLKPMRAGIQPITADERRSRIEKAQRLMVEHRIDAVCIEGGSSLFYYTGVRWGLSERPFVCVIPARGDMGWVCPAFEEARARELVTGQADVRVWQEDESPYAAIAGILKDRGAATGRVGVEERLRYFVYSGVRKAAPGAEFVDAEVVTAGCRMYKSAAEIALMQRAMDITIAAYKAAFATFREGMTQGELSGHIAAAFRALGVTGGAMVSFGKATAFPHGSIEPQSLKPGDVVLVDGGCSVEGYQSDITRTTVFGPPTARQTEIWNLEKRAQAAGFAAARLGAPCEAVDAAARQAIVDAGFGPDYRVPGLPHRTGHGIGLDGHEWTNFVRGNRTPLAPGMCFSNEPTVVIYGEFGVRLEDCLYMTDEGPRWFTEPSPAVDRPFAG